MGALTGCFGDRTSNEDAGEPGPADGGDTFDAGAIVGEGGTQPDPDRQGLACGVAGRSVACTGPAGCSGAQVCQGNGTYGACDCGVSPVDGGLVPSDGGVPIEPPACGAGAACTSDLDCVSGLSCVAELSLQLSVNGLPSGALVLERQEFPGGMCSAAPFGPYGTPGTCDPFAPPSQQGCGDCGVCAYQAFTTGTFTFCAESCTPSLTSNGCSRPEYRCSLDLHTCEGGCASDEECRIVTLDIDGDLLPDLLQYDDFSTVYCDAATRRCTNPGNPDAEAGDPCERHEDCEPGGVCYQEGASVFFANPYLGGACGKLSCDTPGFECAGNGECVRARGWDAAPPAVGYQCARSCTQGMEPVDAQLGASGHGDTCRDGYMCLWSGRIGDPSGTCTPGNYNDVTVNNVGSSCATPLDCHSPMGHAVCMALISGAWSYQMCTIMDCAAPGLPDDVCGAGNTCLNLDNRRTMCAQQCTDATTCPDGFGCIDHDLRSTTPNVCFPGCQLDTECRPGQTCSASICGP